MDEEGGTLSNEVYNTFVKLITNNPVFRRTK